MKNDLILKNVELLAEICPKVSKVYLENKFYRLTAADIFAAAQISKHEDFQRLKEDSEKEIKQLIRDGNRLLKKPDEGVLYWAKDLSKRAVTALDKLGYRSKEQLIADLSSDSFYMRSCKNIGDNLDYEILRWYKRNKAI